MYTIHTIAHAFHTIIIRHIVQNNTYYPHYFLPFDEYIPTVMFVHIVQWSDISHFYVQLPLKSPQNWLFWLKIVRKISSPTNFTTWNVRFIGIFTSYKLQKCEKYNLHQIHHIRTYCNSKVLWYVFILNCVYTGHNLMNCMVLYAQFR